MQRRWFQDKTFPHYDLTSGKRELALRHGAVPIAAGEFPLDLLVKGPNGYELYIDRAARLDLKHTTSSKGHKGQ